MYILSIASKSRILSSICQCKAKLQNGYADLAMSSTSHIPSSACSSCGESDEFLEHLFLSCHYTKNLWAEVIKWLVDHTARPKIFQTKIYCLVLFEVRTRYLWIIIFLLAKQYLYFCRQNKYSPSIRVLHSKINTILLFETMIAKSNNKLETHNRNGTNINLISIRSFSRLLHLLFCSCK